MLILDTDNTASQVYSPASEILSETKSRDDSLVVSKGSTLILSSK